MEMEVRAHFTNRLIAAESPRDSEKSESTTGSLFKFFVSLFLIL